MKVSVLGLGRIGLPVAAYVAEKGLEVSGYDIDPTAVASAKRSGLQATTNWKEVPNSEVYLICVSTLWKKGQPYIKPVTDTCRKISERATPRTLVSVESTVLPGTCRRIYERIFKKRIQLVHVPHRYWEADPINHGVKQLRVIGSIDQKSLETGTAFYRDKLGIPLHTTPNIEAAEMCKVTENAHFYIQIAFAEEIRLICAEMNIDFEEVRKACNTKWNVQMLEARDGIKGHCIPKDMKYLTYLTKNKKLLQGAMKADNTYRKWLATHGRKTKTSTNRHQHAH